jgi:RND family efflux transporter MFP subunit
MTLAGIGAALALLFAPLLVGCSRAPGEVTASAAPAPPVRTVGVVAVAQGDVARTLTQPGSLQGIQEATLYAKAAGYLKRIDVDKGDRVRAGQVLAVIESPELLHQQDQARATYAQSQAAALGVVASKGRAEADAAASAAVVDRARSDQARVEAQLPKLQAMVEEADANAEQAVEQRAQSQADVGRWEQQVKVSQANLRAVQSALAKAEADARLQQLTYSRLKAIQDKDSGLVPAQDVDVARARMEASQSEAASVRDRVEAARQDGAAVEQQLEGARRGAAAAAKKVEAARSHAQAARADVQVSQREIESARQQVRVASSQRRALGEQIRVAETQVTASRQQSQASRSALSAASDMAGYTRIVAPFDGVVTERLADPGALVQNAGNNQAAARGIVKVVQDRALRVMIPIPETDIPSIRKGQPAVLTVDAYPKESFRGTVTRFSSAVDPRSRTMLTEVDLPNRDGRLRPGMYARVTLTLAVHHNALSVPSEAVMGKDQDRFVYTVEGGKAHKTVVKVGVDDGKLAEITDGLKPGAQVVLVGRDNLVNGATVKAEPAPAEPAKR